MAAVRETIGIATRCKLSTLTFAGAVSAYVANAVQLVPLHTAINPNRAKTRLVGNSTCLINRSRLTLELSCERADARAKRILMPSVLYCERCHRPLFTPAVPHARQLQRSLAGWLLGLNSKVARPATAPQRSERDNECRKRDDRQGQIRVGDPMPVCCIPRRRRPGGSNAEGSSHHHPCEAEHHTSQREQRQ